MESIKAIFFDLDGTLVGHEGVISKEAEDKINELVKKGIKIYICTGRNFVQTKIITKNLVGVGYITNNGAYAADFYGKKLFEHKLEKDKFMKFLEEAINFGDLNLFIQNSNQIITNSSKNKRFFDLFIKNIKEISIKKIREYLRKEVNLGHIVKYEKDLKNYFQNSKESWYKILVFGNEKHIKTLANNYKDDFSFSFSAKENIEVNERGVSKGEAVRVICETNGLELRETMCFGDSGNDIEMFKVCGIPVVMANSKVKELHSLAKFTADSYEINGVYKFLKEHF